MESLNCNQFECFGMMNAYKIGDHVCGKLCFFFSPHNYLQLEILWFEMRRQIAAPEPNLLLIVLPQKHRRKDDHWLAQNVQTSYNFGFT